MMDHHRLRYMAKLEGWIREEAAVMVSSGRESSVSPQLEAAAGKRSIDGLEAVGEIDVNQEHLVGVATLKVYIQ